MTTGIEVMERAVERRSVSLFTPRRLVLAFVVFAAVLMPVAALGAAKDWWFLRYGGTPVPTTAPRS